MFVRPTAPLETPNGTVFAWAYVGSANLSESAWSVPHLFILSNSMAVKTNRRNQNRGKMVTDRNTKQPKLNVKNWETGVVVPVMKPPHSYQSPSEYGTPAIGSGGNAAAAGRTYGGTGVPGWTVFAGKDGVPVPMVLPAQPIGKRQPWFFMGPQ